MESHHPDLFWYGVHGVEGLFTIMGTGCEQVTRVQTKGSEMAVGVWAGGRIGTFRGIRQGKGGYGANVIGETGMTDAGKFEGYAGLVEQACIFFHTGKPPVSEAETLEIFAFMEAADESKRQGGKPVSVADVLETARKTVAERRAAK